MQDQLFSKHSHSPTQRNSLHPTELLTEQSEGNKQHINYNTGYDMHT